jgi:hypothetical protein
MKLLIYIYTGPVKRESAGSSAMIKLGENLKKRGHEVRIINYKITPNSFKSLSKYSLVEFFRNKDWKKRPILIYPESIPYNLLGATRPVWYLLSHPSELYNFPADTSRLSVRKTFSFSKNIKESWKSSGPVVHSSTLDLYELTNFRYRVKMTKEIVYTGKYVDLYKQCLPSPVNDLFQLTRNPKTLTRNDFLDELSKSEILHCFENTAVALEAIFMDVKVIFHFNEYFTAPIIDSEILGIQITRHNDGSQTGSVLNPQAASNAYLKHIEEQADLSHFEEWLHEYQMSNVKHLEFMGIGLFQNMLPIRFLLHKTLIVLRYLRMRSMRRTR